MASFRESLLSDLRNTFFNSNEFAELHNVDGQGLYIIIDEDLLKEMQIRQQQDGVYKSGIIFQVEKSAFGDKPAVGQRIKLDYKNYKVKDCNESEGMYTIILEANRA